MLTVAILGPVELRHAGVLLPLPSGRTTEVLVRLALEAGVPVRAERLIEDLWSAQAPGTARNTLQSKVSQLRRVLAGAAAVTGGASGYTLDVDPGSVDALEVLRLAAAVGSLREAGDHEAVVQTAASALARFHGEILPGAGDGDWVAPYRAQLEEARLRLTEDQLAARIELGATGELVGPLQGLVAVHPLRERLWTLLITALYRSGRQADALATFRQVRQRLADDLGLDPGPQLQALEQRILRQDPGLSGRIVPPDRINGPARGNLPGLTASLIGRETDQLALGALVGEQRLVTVLGPAGVGKTRLAIEVARSAGLPGGAWLVRLESVRAGASPWPALGEVFNLGAATPPMVLERIRADELLIVLDNCEHLIEILPEVVDRMLTAAPGLRVLATSQLPLAVDGEAGYPLAPLDLGDSVRLFTERAARQRPSFHLDADTGPVVEAVCRALDGLPLAIELAAARAKALSVQEIARRLDDRFALLSDPTSRRPARRRTLSAALSWSYDLLFPDDQRGLWALACFSGGAPLAAVEPVLAALGVPVAVAVDVLDRLVDRSLVGVEVSAGGAVRYRLLDSIREFSRDRLRAAGLDDVARAAHAAWFAIAAARAASRIRGPEQAEQLMLARTERTNIDDALAWAARRDPRLGLRIATGFGWAWAVLGTGVEGARRIRTALAAVDADDGEPGDAADDELRVTALLLAGWLEAAGGNLELALADVERAQRIGNQEQRAVAQVYLGFVRTQQGRPHEVVEVLADCRPDLRRFGREWEEAASWLLTAWAQIALGETALGRAACDQAQRRFGPLGDDWARIHTEAMLGALAQAEHRFREAAGHLERAAGAAHKLGFAAAEALHRANLGRALDRSGDHEIAVATLERAIETALDAGDLRLVAIARVHLGRVFRFLGDRPAARASAQAALRWYRSAGGGEGASLAEYLLAVLAVDDRCLDHAEIASGAMDFDAMCGPLGELLEGARRGGDVEVELLALDALARVHAEAGQLKDAQVRLDAADRLLPAARHLVTEHDRIDAQRARSRLSAGRTRAAPAAGS